MRDRPRAQEVRGRPPRTGGPACSDRSRAAVSLSIAGGVVAALATGCGSGGHVRVTDPARATSPAPAATSASPTPSVQEQILRQYSAFWAHLTPASVAPAEQRRAILAPYTDDPELASLIRGMAQQDARGEVIYGENIPHPTISSLSPTQGLAVIGDCQDSSHSGVERRLDHSLVTVGVKNNPVITTMRRDRDGRWRVTFVSYPKKSC